jgi:hypothetical protein
MAQLADLAAPKMRAATGFHRHDARGQLAEKLQHLRSPYLFAQNGPPCAVSSMHLKHVLRQIEPDRDNLRHDRSPSMDRCRPTLAHQMPSGGVYSIKAAQPRWPRKIRRPHALATA